MSNKEFERLFDITNQLFAANQTMLAALINVLERQSTLVKNDFYKELRYLKDNTGPFGVYADLILDLMLNGTHGGTRKVPLSPEQLRALLSVVQGGKSESTEKED